MIQFLCWRPGPIEATSDFPESLPGSGAQGGHLWVLGAFPLP